VVASFESNHRYMIQSKAILLPSKLTFENREKPVLNSKQLTS
jgi:hypothetical protein